jgi:hypothetical protein
MPSHPWLSVTQNDQNITLWSHKTPLYDISDCGNTASSIITLIGRTEKSRFLGRLLKYAKPLEEHGQVRIIQKKDERDAHLKSFILDCELTSSTSSGFRPDSATCSPHTVEWFRKEQPCPTLFSDYIISYVLAPVSSVLCFFAEDMDGLSGTIRRLAAQAMLPKAHNAPQSTLPRVLIIVESTPRSDKRPNSSMEDLVIQDIIRSGSLSSLEDASRQVEKTFHSIHVVNFRKGSSQQSKTANLCKRLKVLRQDVYWARRTSRYLFIDRHVSAFLSRLVTKFCQKRECFDFVREACPNEFDGNQIKEHIEEFLSLLPGQNWLWKVVAPLLASSFCLASYPPGSHSKSL